ncbi:hypothetical protein CVS30_16740 [Arthrobacter psychrolactophilus]|uniref:Uncharacterized protein n=2 Tax=Arthrobacter psychrolactophilus TaxID=92442 RepID=A0A2V5JJ88_9MICC|nr:hypothetical protein CVS30_16740 [Arthrobacter psychrolactophilus]
MIFIDQLIDLDGRWTHVVMLEITPESTLLHLRREVKHPFGVAHDTPNSTLALMSDFPSVVLRDESRELSVTGAQGGGSGMHDQIVLAYDSQVRGDVAVLNSLGAELLTVKL